MNRVRAGSRITKIDPFHARRAASSLNRLDRPASSARVFLPIVLLRWKGLPAEGGFGDVPDLLRASSLLLTIILTLAFFTGCQSKTKDRADSNSIMRKFDGGREIHGEVGAMYGRSASRH